MEQRELTTVVHLVASPFFGGPERQILGLSRALAGRYRTVIVSFAENGACRPFLDEARRRGLETHELHHNSPRYLRSIGEIRHVLASVSADIVCTHGYKPDLLGYFAARRLGLPCVAVSRGWTGATLKVRLNEWLDRQVLRWMDAVVCVSEGQAEKIRRCGIAQEKVKVIRNAIDVERFSQLQPRSRVQLSSLFPVSPRWIVLAAGRLSPEKGFDVLIDAAGIVLRRRHDTGFVIFGDGSERESLEQRIADLGLSSRVVLGGFRSDLDALLPQADVFVLPSHTEGLPNVVLEASAAGVAVVATAVGGTPEVVEDGRSGLLVPPGQPESLASRIEELLGDPERRKAMGEYGRQRVSREFTFQSQADHYHRLFRELLGDSARASRSPGCRLHDVVGAS